MRHHNAKDPRDAIRTLSDAYGLSMSDAARVYAGYANYSVERGLY